MSREEKKALDEAEERVKLLKDMEKLEDPGARPFTCASRTRASVHRMIAAACLQDFNHSDRGPHYKALILEACKKPDHMLCQKGRKSRKN